MDDFTVRYTLRIEKELLDKLAYVSKYNSRNKNQEIRSLIVKHIQQFESEHGQIQQSEISDANMTSN